MCKKWVTMLVFVETFPAVYILSTRIAKTSLMNHKLFGSGGAGILRREHINNMKFEQDLTVLNFSYFLIMYGSNYPELPCKRGAIFCHGFATTGKDRLVSATMLRMAYSTMIKIGMALFSPPR